MYHGKPFEIIFEKLDQVERQLNDLAARNVEPKVKDSGIAITNADPFITPD